METARIICCRCHCEAVVPSPSWYLWRRVCEFCIEAENLMYLHRAVETMQRYNEDDYYFLADLG